MTTCTSTDSAAVPLENTLYVAGLNLKCNKCQTLFHFQEDFTNHMVIDHNIARPYQCTQCHGDFGEKMQLIHHIEEDHTETGQERFQCSQCSLSFSTKGARKNHIRRIHDKEVNFECTDCGKGFYTKMAWTIHCRVHSGERPFVCRA